ncbi:hypothetical protein [Oceanobacillus jeddahense]|uniref:Transporter n=1 Tax=Oceanobacillus jeddahense TaxID=1462527 RepID=A0ABY5JYA3_9BACI|nr:hypothetical protein [Oceanobacillus jeddahense]UUI05205.1 hypothetical protein NP439_11410 [Oceanobacillus jeddahense]
MSSNNAERNSIKAYLQWNLPSLIFHFFLTVFAMLTVLFVNQLQIIFFGVLIAYTLFGLALKNQGTLFKNIQSVSLVFIINLIMYTLVPLAVAEVLMFYSLPYLYLAFINEQLIFLAIILPSICMLIGLYVKILITNFKK